MPETEQFEPGSIEFDLDNITARETSAYMQALRTGDMETIAAFLARVVVKGPWEKLDSPDTYLDLPLKKWRAVINALGTESSGKN